MEQAPKPNNKNNSQKSTGSGSGSSTATPVTDKKTVVAGMDIRSVVVGSVKGAGRGNRYSSSDHAAFDPARELRKMRANDKNRASHSAAFWKTPDSASTAKNWRDTKEEGKTKATTAAASFSSSSSSASAATASATTASGSGGGGGYTKGPIDFKKLPAPSDAGNAADSSPKTQVATVTSAYNYRDRQLEPKAIPHSSTLLPQLSESNDRLVTCNDMRSRVTSVGDVHTIYYAVWTLKPYMVTKIDALGNDNQKRSVLNPLLSDKSPLVCEYRTVAELLAWCSCLVTGLTYDLIETLQLITVRRECNPKAEPLKVHVVAPGTDELKANCDKFQDSTHSRDATFLIEPANKKDETSNYSDTTNRMLASIAETSGDSSRAVLFLQSQDWIHPTQFFYPNVTPLNQSFYDILMESKFGVIFMCDRESWLRSLDVNAVNKLEQKFTVYAPEAAWHAHHKERLRGFQQSKKICYYIFVRHGSVL